MHGSAAGRRAGSAADRLKYICHIMTHVYKSMKSLKMLHQYNLATEDQQPILKNAVDCVAIL